MTTETNGEFRTDLNVRHEGRRANEAPTLFLLHGLTDSREGWGPAVAHWGQSYSIVAVDQRGHGESPRFTDEQLAGHPGDLLVDDAIGLLEQLGEAPVVVGHSLGGAVALVAAVRRPDLVRGVVLEDPAPLGPGEQLRDAARGREYADSLGESIAATNDQELVEARRRKHPTWREDELLATGRAEQQTDRRFLEHGEWKPTTPWPKLFEELIVPVLVLSGDAMDEVCVDDTLEKGIAESGNENLVLVRIRSAGHCIRREQPERFFEAVDAWLATH